MTRRRAVAGRGLEAQVVDARGQVVELVSLLGRGNGDVAQRTVDRVERGRPVRVEGSGSRQGGKWESTDALERRAAELLPRELVLEADHVLLKLLDLGPHSVNLEADSALVLALLRAELAHADQLGESGVLAGADEARGFLALGFSCVGRTRRTVSIALDDWAPRAAGGRETHPSRAGSGARRCASSGRRPQRGAIRRPAWPPASTRAAWRGHRSPSPRACSSRARPRRWTGTAA